MGKRQLSINWSKVPGAKVPRKRICLKLSSNGVYQCPDTQCLHYGFKSKRGCRKHINSKHAWLYYFEKRPTVNSDILESARRDPISKVETAKMPSFDVDQGFGKTFVDWITTPFGGNKNHREAVQCGKRGLKYLMYCTGCSEICDELDTNFVDCCLGSASMIVNFLKELQTDWDMGHAGAINYLKSISDMMDFRKSQGVTDGVLRSFSITEVYLRRARRCLSKKMTAQWSRNFDLETLIANDSWASVEDMEKVIPYHLPRFKNVIQTCKGLPVNDISLADLTFATRFITTFLFLNVKCSRPMTFQRLTVPMIEKAKKDNGYIDQKDFKTSETYLYDTLIFSNDALELVSLYINHCRGLMDPKCDFVLVNNNGNMCTNLCHSMTILVYEAIGKHINPTRYRQIIETASSEKLTVEEQRIISQDQKHNSTVAQVFYKKRLSRDIAEKGRVCMDKIGGTSRADTNEAISGVVQDLTGAEQSFGINVLSGPIICNNQEPGDASNVTGDIILNADPKESTGNFQCAQLVQDENMPEIKEEDQLDATRQRLPFTTPEDMQLCHGINRFGRRKWAVILKDGQSVFHSSRTRDSLRMRAQSKGFKALYRC